MAWIPLHWRRASSPLTCPYKRPSLTFILAHREQHLGKGLPSLGNDGGRTELLQGAAGKPDSTGGAQRLERALCDGNHLTYRTAAVGYRHHLPCCSPCDDPRSVLLEFPYADLSHVLQSGT